MTASYCSFTQPVSATSIICNGVLSMPAVYRARSPALG
jgi:hypothetical protein